tara:strand:- start:1904 stop:2641 length:738 start_codon:yes stop_codon:yes gene_type:complete
MEFSILDSKLFTSVFENMKQFSEQTKMKINSDGIHLQSLDDANVSIIDIQFNKNYFTDYNIQEEIIYDFSLNELCKILKICSKSRIMHFMFNANILTISSHNIDCDITKKFEINSIITKDTFLNLENLRSTNLYNINLDSKNLQNIFNELFIFSDDICIELQKNKLKFYTINDTINTDYIINLPENNNTINPSKYSLNYLSKYKFSSIFEDITMKFNSNSPLLLVNKNEYIECHFILSPKIIDID